MECLLAAGADLRRSTGILVGASWWPHMLCEGCSPLHLAASVGSAEIVRMLLESYVRNVLLPGLREGLTLSQVSERAGGDPRRARNSDFFRPCDVAKRLGAPWQVATLLQPNYNLVTWFTDGSSLPAALRGAVPPLRLLAAAAHNQRLLQQVSSLQRGCCDLDQSSQEEEEGAPQVPEPVSSSSSTCSSVDGGKGRVCWGSTTLLQGHTPATAPVGSASNSVAAGSGVSPVGGASSCPTVAAVVPLQLCIVATSGGEEAVTATIVVLVDVTEPGAAAAGFSPLRSAEEEGVCAAACTQSAVCGPTGAVDTGVAASSSAGSSCCDGAVDVILGGATAYVNTDECGVCLESGRFALALTPCSHRVCASCVSSLITVRADKVAYCPFCRAIISGVERAR